jgi:hypothetical protein
MRKMTGTDPEQIADRYIDVLTGITPHEEFAAAYMSTPSEEVQRRFFNLLEGFRYRMFMFTSCGWFFNDISGLEPRQNIQYAYKTIRLFQPYSESDLYGILESHLAAAHSNIPSEGTGADLLARAVPGLSPGLEAATYYFLKLLIHEETPDFEPYGFFNLSDYRVRSRGEKEAEAAFTVRDTTTCEHYSYDFAAHTGTDGGLQLMISDTSDGTEGGKDFTLDLNLLPAELRQTITGFLMRTTEQSFSESASEIFDQARFAVIQTARLGTELPGIIRKSAELSLYTLLRRFVNQRDRLLERERVEEIEELLSFAVTFDLRFEKEEIRAELTAFFWEIFATFSGEGAPPKSDLVVRLIRAFSGAGLKPDLTIPQKHVFTAVRHWRRSMSGSSELDFTRSEGAERNAYRQLSAERKDDLQRTVALADIMGIYADDLKRLVSSPS